MQARLTAGRWTMRVGSSNCTNRIWKHEQRRQVVGKASSRAAVPGTKLPVTDTVNKDEVEMKINQGQENREKKREGMEKIVDSQPSQPQEPDSGSPTK